MNNVLPLFSTPIMAYDKYVGDKPEQHIVDYITTLEMISNKGNNLASKDTYILNDAKFQQIRNRIEEAIASYVSDVLSIKNLTFYITQSWLNVNPPGTEHHIHHHSNSILSGVYYIDVHDTSLKFHASNHFINSGSIVLSPDSYNLFNSTIWRLPVYNGMTVIFPSSTTHSVDINMSDTLSRISLAFNVFVKGTVGEESNLNKLVL